MVTYHEVQRFRDTAICWVVLAVHLQALALVGLLLLGDGANLVRTAIVGVVLALPVVPLSTASLVTEVDTDGGVVRIRVAPFPWTRTVALADFTAVERIEDFPALGASLGVESALSGRKNTTYCLATAGGVRIRLRDSREIRLGSRRPAELFGTLDSVGVSGR
ncbi:hypothetical protein AUR64_18875 [Haloprofundus marisrubri]|uniref:Bacterial Pleckstrin homology domain-containing protein n=1 Tax=Haloprofundus marisrubri TaxID=1514971 RepID=A0A0W1R605_9EURY|nr:hypothetical protein [Haloprofundus marisrubri]KTG08304.1 hypothetical protein AUR64_18875 [Haloprofundus marisrubri]